MAAFITKRFVHLTHAQAGETVFADAETDDETSHFYDLVGSSVTEAELVEHTGTPYGSATAIPPTAVVFVDFPDGTTGIISHLKFYSKLDELGGGSEPTGAEGIKVIESEDMTFPSETQTDLGINTGDVVALRNNYSGSYNGFALAICTSASSYEDSGTMHYNYYWQEVYRWPNSMGWADATTPLGS